MQILNPSEWDKPRGFSHGIATQGRFIFVAGQVGCDEHQVINVTDFAGQLRQALSNTVRVLETGGARPEHIARMTWYVTDKNDYLANLKEVGKAYRDVLGRVFPAMALLEVSGLVDDAALIEIETTAVVPIES